jgi:transposase
MDVTLLLPGSAILQLESLSFDEANRQFTVTLTSRQDALQCPVCRASATRVHSQYTRTIADLPWADVQVQLHLQVRKGFCPTSDCPRSIFTERLPALVAPYARRTTRLATAQRHLGVALGGTVGADLSDALEMPTIQDTLLRLVQHTAPSTPVTPRALGVDDFAFRKGYTYGTILVDLELQRPIDLLPDRTAETLAQWLRDHPGVEIISRDRAGAYAEGARQGAPDALQVADRFHLIQNLADALIRVFEQHHRDLTAALASPSPALPDVVQPSAPVRTTQAEHDQLQRRERRQARYDAVWALHRQGWTNRAIADHLDLHRDTISKYLHTTDFPEYQTPHRRAHVLGCHQAYILERWNAGCQNGRTLLAELIARGYQGSPSTLFNYLTQLRKDHGLPPKKRAPGTIATTRDPATRPATPRGLAWLFLKRPKSLTTSDQEQMLRAREAHPDLRRGVQLAQDFVTIVRERRHEALDSWLEQAEQSELVPFRNFAASLRRDYAAVKAGVTVHWNNGQTEGQVNRLKMLKRQLYGRASFSLLRQRVLNVRPRATPKVDHQKCA